MKAARVPGASYRDGSHLVSTNPRDGSEVARVPVAGAGDIAAAAASAATAGAWWAGLGHAERRRRLLRFAALLAARIHELARVVGEETGKPAADAAVEITAAVEHLAWAARNARRVLGRRRAGSSLLQPEYTAWVEHRPYGVVGVIGPWNYPVFTPLGSIGGALAAGNSVIFKPSEYTPAVGRWLVEAFGTVVPEQPVLRAVYGMGDTGAALCAAGLDKIAFTGSTATGRAVASACAATLTPVLLECGGKDAAIVDADADLAAAAGACVWGAMGNAGQTCVGIECVYVVDAVYQQFLDLLVERAGRLRVGPGEDADLGPITMPSLLDTIREHIDDALARGGRAVLGGPDAIQPPYVLPTILVDVPADALAACEETFGPTLVVFRVADVEEAVRRVNAGRYRLGSAVFAGSGARGAATARRLGAGMTAVNSALSFAGVGSLPFGGVGASGYGRTHGADGLREFAWAKSIAVRRFRSPVAVLTFDRSTRALGRMVAALRALHGRQR